MFTLQSLFLYFLIIQNRNPFVIFLLRHCLPLPVTRPTNPTRFVVFRDTSNWIGRLFEFQKWWRSRVSPPIYTKFSWKISCFTLEKCWNVCNKRRAFNGWCLCGSRDWFSFDIWGWWCWSRWGKWTPFRAKGKLLVFVVLWCVRRVVKSLIN